MIKRDHVDRRAVLILIGLCVLWGIQQVFVKIAMEGVSPLFQAGLRSVGSALLLAGWARLQGVRLIGSDGAWKPGLVVGALFALEFVGIFLGAARTTAARAVLFIYTAPIAIAVFAHFLLPKERLVGWQVAGMGAAFLGVAAAFWDGASGSDPTAMLGDALCLGAAIMWAAATMVIRKTRLTNISAIRTLFFQLVVTAALLLPLSYLAGEPGITKLTPAILFSLVYQTAIVGFISYLAWFWMVAVYPSARLAAFTFLTPLVGAAAGWAWLGDPLRPAFGAAIALVCIGIWLVNRRPAAA